MSERLWKATLTVAQLESWLKPPRNDAPFAILESLHDIGFPAKDEPILLADWPRGRIFGDSFELRWERAGEAYRVWLVGAAQTQAETQGFAEPALNEVATYETHTCFLWGRDEQRIARTLVYRALPDGGGRAQLVRREFRDAAGALCYERYVKMVREEKHEPL